MSHDRQTFPDFNAWLLASALMVCACATSCQEGDNAGPPQSGSASGVATSDQPAQADENEQFRKDRLRMVEQHLAARDIVDQRVLDVMNRIPRHEFVPWRARQVAYIDSPLSIGHGQTISQPYIVALMTQLVRPNPDAKALDIGTGSGYQAAVLAELVKEVYSIEILEPLAKQARKRLRTLGYKNIHVRSGDGYRGWPEQAPFDIIIVAAAPDHVPQALVEQLAPGGIMVIPVGRFYQSLMVISKNAAGKVSVDNAAPVSFVPMTGEAQKRSTTAPSMSE